MATLASNVTWGSGPTNTFNFSYEKKREGATQYYKITVSCNPCTGASYFGYPIYLEIKLAGSTAATHTLKAASPSQWSSALTYTTDWLAVQNKTDGTTALAIRIYSGLGSSRNTTYSYSLAVDPAASKIGATDANIESSSVISITRYSSNFTTTVSYKADGQSSYTTIWEKQNYITYAWTVPSSLYSLIPKAKEIKISLECKTYSGGSLIGTEYATLTAKASESLCKPTVSVSSEDINTGSIALTGNKKTIVNGISKLRVNTTATANKSATISNITVYCGGESLSGSSVTFYGAASNSVYVIVTDSRGFSTRVDDKTLTFVNYIIPTITPTITRDTPTGDTVTVYVKGLCFNGSFGSVTNTLKVSVSYKVDGASSYGSEKEMTVTKGSNEYTATIKLSGLAYTNAYRFQILLKDSVYSSGKAVTDIYLSKGIPVFDWGENDFAFNVPVNIKAGINIYPEDGSAVIGEDGNSGMALTYIVQQGITDRWTYRLWSDGIAELWGLITAIHHNGSILGGEKRFPFALTGNIYGIATLNSAGGNSGAALPWNVKLVYNTELCGAWVHNSGSVGFATDSTADVSVYIVGRWK